jgi:cellulose synthase/poly-beta-1,6-N-acetylglucosamine synthase-like glycosyltransferase
MNLQTHSGEISNDNKAIFGRVLLIVPCYNESDRLNLAEFNRYAQYSFLFCDDGSTDQTFELLKNFENESMQQKSEKSVWTFKSWVNSNGLDFGMLI